MSTTTATHATTAPPAPTVGGVVRRHWLFGLLLTAGVVLRVLAMAAYRPALLFLDALSYLASIGLLRPSDRRPIGFPVVLRGLLGLSGGDVQIVPLVHHVLGIALAVGIYALLLRAGARRWVAALATSPVLLDAYQVQIEQNVMSEPSFVALTFTGLVLVVDGAGRHRAMLRTRLVTAAAAGLLLGLAVPVRLIGQFLVVPCAIYLLFEGGRRWSHRALAVMVFVALFLVPVLSYMAYMRAWTGDFTLTTIGGRMIYGRVAPVVDCERIAIRADLAALCPDEPVGQRRMIDDYVWSSGSPINRFDPPKGMTQDQALREFAGLVIRQQPLEVARAAMIDMGKMFWPTRAQFANDLDVTRWQFQLTFPDYGSHDLLKVFEITPRADPTLARLLRAYQLTVGWTPGPVLLAALLMGLAGGLGVGRARRSSLGAPCLLWSVSGVVLAVLPAAYEFSWRYMLPALVFMPVAGGLGLTAVAGHDVGAGRSGAVWRTPAGLRSP